MLNQLNSESKEERFSAINQIANLSQFDKSHKALLPQIGNLLFDEFEEIRFTAAFSLVNFAEKGIDISEIEAELAKALNDESLRVRKEVDWALYCIAFEGNSIKNAALVYEKELSEKNTIRGNAAIALCLHYLYNNQDEKAFDLVKLPNGDIQFGVAWAHTDYTIKTGKKEYVKKIADIIRPALLDIGMHNGIAGSLNWAEQRGLDITAAVDGINELINSTDDMMKQAKLGGIFSKMQQKRY